MTVINLDINEVLKSKLMLLMEEFQSHRTTTNAILNCQNLI